jgi:hypothetical protein
MVDSSLYGIDDVYMGIYRDADNRVYIHNRNATDSKLNNVYLEKFKAFVFNKKPSFLQALITVMVGGLVGLMTIYFIVHILGIGNFNLHW